MTDRDKLHWCDGSGRLNLQATREEFESGSHSGDCEDSVRGLYSLPHIKAQVDAWPMADMVANLLGYGAWEREELEGDEDMTRMRTLWLACGDVADGSCDEEEEEEA